MIKDILARCAADQPFMIGLMILLIITIFVGIIAMNRPSVNKIWWREVKAKWNKFNHWINPSWKRLKKGHYIKRKYYNQMVDEVSEDE